jgi:aspartate ammonia-lyase
MRLEHDLLGELEIPAEAYWGIHTARAVSNFPISGVPIAHYRSLIRALALVKEAAADANFKVGELDGEGLGAVFIVQDDLAEILGGGVVEGGELLAVLQV